MTDLTEQWKKGELEEGWYYINNGQIDYKYSKHSFVDFFITPHEDIKKVLAPVPSFEEWQEKLDENQQLKGYNEYLRNIIIECEPYIENVCTALNMEKFANGVFLHKSNEVLSKIRTVIGEKK